MFYGIESTCQLPHKKETYQKIATKQNNDCAKYHWAITALRLKWNRRIANKCEQYGESCITLISSPSINVCIQTNFPKTKID